MGGLALRSIRCVVREIAPIIAKAGASYRLDPGSAGSHAKLFIEYRGKTRFTPLSGSPKTIDNAVKYKVADVRRILREMGA